MVLTQDSPPLSLPTPSPSPVCPNGSRPGLVGCLFLGAVLDRHTTSAVLFGIASGEGGRRKGREGWEGGRGLVTQSPAVSFPHPRPASSGRGRGMATRRSRNGHCVDIALACVPLRQFSVDGGRRAAR